MVGVSQNQGEEAVDPQTHIGQVCLHKLLVVKLGYGLETEKFGKSAILRRSFLIITLFG